MAQPRYRAITDQRAARGKAQADQQASEDFDAPVPVWMVFIGGLGRQREAQQHEARDEDVAGRFQTVGDHRRGMASDAGNQLHQG
jgi:hypothetical protein